MYSSTLSLSALVILLAIIRVSAQDPASGWLGYAKGVDPEASSSRMLTKMEAYWRVCDVPTHTSCYFTPWFGIETSDNLNLLQPVNPFSHQWEIYNEYFQWHPEHNTNSRSHNVKPNDIIYGSVVYNGNANAQAYTIHIGDLNDQWSVDTVIDVQKDNNGNYKKYTIGYVVFEHACQTCAYYPPQNEITFYNISMYYDNELVSPQWSTGYETNRCNNRAKIVNETAVQITWQSA